MFAYNLNIIQPPSEKKGEIMDEPSNAKEVESRRML
jgi:hypothetical protein